MNSSDKSFFQSKKVWTVILALIANMITLIGYFFGLPENVTITIISSVSGVISVYLISQGIIDKNAVATPPSLLDKNKNEGKNNG